MHNRLRLLKGATALMYFGTLLAGLAGQAWAMLPVFVAIFLLWSVILRPHLWPARLGDLRQRDAAVALAALVASQVLLVVLCFAVGRGIGGVLGLRPALPLWLPAALAFLAVPLSRMIWNPRVMAGNVGFDPLLHPAAPVREGVEGMLAEVTRLPDSVTEEELQPLISAIAAQGDPVVIRQALSAPQISRAGRKAMILHATDPEASALLSGSRYIAQAFAAAGQDGELLELFARRCVRVLGDEPELAADCPSPDVVAKAALAAGQTDAGHWLGRLAGLLEQGRAEPVSPAAQPVLRAGHDG